ncbi:MAG: hypothetical protein WC955_10035 [Elusimicrobiota bacterium]
MKKCVVLKVVMLAAVALLCIANVAAKTIYIDGDTTGASEWAVIPGTVTLTPNTAVVYDNEWIWTDKTYDERRNSVYCGTTAYNASTDLTQVRVTASASSLFFYFQFRELSYSATGYVYPYIQVAIDYRVSEGKADLLNWPANANANKINSRAAWELLCLIYQSTPSSDASVSQVDNYNTIFNSSYQQQSFYNAYNHFASTYTGSSGPFFIEAEVPMVTTLSSSSDIRSRVLGNRVRFSVSVFPHSAVETGSPGLPAMYGSLGESDILDCISVKDSDAVTADKDNQVYGNATAGTWEETKDNVVDYFFDIKFNYDGTISVNTPPEKPANLVTDGKAGNVNVVVSSHVPNFTWYYNDINSDEVRAADIQIGTDSDWSNGAETWAPATVVVATSAIKFDSTAVLAADTTYYWRVRCMDSIGSWGEWSDTAKFVTVGQAMKFDENEKMDINVAGNNPFNPKLGQTTKIRYVVTDSLAVKVKVVLYTMDGRVVKVLADEYVEKDAYNTAEWDGYNLGGVLVAPGLYIVNITAGDKLQKNVTLAVVY